jgi:hypothetical protein
MPEETHMTQAEKTDALRYVDGEKSLWGTYHNHKETSSWGALVLFVVIVGQLGGVVSGNLESSFVVSKLSQYLPNAKWLITFDIKVLVSLVIIFIGKILLEYLRTQSIFRHLAADAVAACCVVGTNIISGHIDYKKEDFQVTANPSGALTQAEYVLPSCIIDEMKKIMGGGLQLTESLEKNIRILVWLLLMLSLTRIWL